ncbi:tyrosine-type recombinase/integrase [Botrimarina hoheduenensis]|uniref:Site-specific tyrosine recombinase XerD n=1 Tax=Botrimarina hoheduenensis TaxID=2528000 RepID=A0A5C5VPU9_9BACT|nr:site-specific integrase [Botrimarina hoheduenensis]TWT40140.1 site-specific tyrosine recombinase XerD [Botrimarina hoheduenensis]
MATPKPPRVPAYRLHKPSNRAYVRINGRFFYLGKYGSQESHDAYAAAVHDYLAGRPIAPSRRLPDPLPEASKLTVRQLADRYIKHAEGYYLKNGVPTSEPGLVANALGRVTKFFADLPAEQFGPLCLEQVRDAMVEDRLKRTTINGFMGRIRRAFKWAASRELIPASTHLALSLVDGLKAGRSGAVDSEPVTPVAKQVVDAALAEMPEVVADMVRFQRYSGCRPGEVCAIRPCDIDRSGDVWRYLPPGHKTIHLGRRRVILIGPRAQGVLLRYLARGPEEYCFQPVDSELKRRALANAIRRTPAGYGNTIGSNRKDNPQRQAGKRYTKNSYAQAIRRACLRAEVEHWTPNQLRHTFATEVRRDHGLEVAQILLGHANAKVTEIYANRDEVHGANVARLIG